ncbi:hypothetical protein A4A49_44089 [Nicotiana attenuata]|uniref:Uncharacterized protein n=1 Tax=Nicotiana attenuata TaxID=49451 RepID=A0A1J6J8G7_NICAT|nr:hypothetical protein A4A49_65856 [Nicotiana attenuata]OIT35387.1 hypothetical protein A4A49_44089 [Nicotiana attenuata]
MAHEEPSSPPNSPTLSLFPLSSEKLSSQLRPRRNPQISNHSEPQPSTILCLSSQPNSSQHFIDLTEEEEPVVILNQESVSRKRKSPATSTNYVSNKFSVKAGTQKKKEPEVLTRNLISNMERSRFCEEKESAEWVFAASSSPPPSTALSLSLPEYAQVKNQEEVGVSQRISYATKKTLHKCPKDWLSL